MIFVHKKGGSFFNIMDTPPNLSLETSKKWVSSWEGGG